jgi:hypothetical protein
MSVEVMKALNEQRLDIGIFLRSEITEICEKL